MKRRDPFTGCEENIESPLEAFHEIKYTIRALREVVYALNIVGLPVAKDIEDVISRVSTLSDLGDKLYMQELNERLAESQESLGLTLTAALEYNLRGDKQ
uniref:Uncharacterized protein n=1 Tax=Vibrio phage P018-4 TaxID=3229728 RepID=A0AB39AJ81_9CAUD